MDIETKDGYSQTPHPEGWGLSQIESLSNLAKS